MPFRRFFLSICLLVVIPASDWVSDASAADWTQFRGPGGLAKSDESGLPVHWSSHENIAWKTELPGMGSSSPIVWEDRVFLTCYTGYGLSEDAPGEMSSLMRHVVCLNRDGGKILWTKSFSPELPESEYEGNGARHGYSTSTPTTDGERLYVFFGTTGVLCLDFDGNLVWRTKVGSGIHGWGSGNSPVLYKNLLIVNASVESRSMVALDKSTGEEVWKAEDIKGCWNTPVLVEAPDGKLELVLSLPGDPGQVTGFDPETGEKLWYCDAIPDRGYVCPSVVAHDGVVYAIGGRKNTAVAVRVGGRGDVTESHKLWEARYGSNVSSPVYHDGHLYWFHERSGTVICLDAKTGDEVFQERLAPRPGLVYASTTFADDKLYCVSQYAGAYVLAAEPEFTLLAHNVFEEDDSRTNASPVVSRGQLLLRSDRFLYCVGKN